MFRRESCGESVPTSLAVLTVTYNTPTINVNETKVTMKGMWRIRDAQMKRKGVNCIEVWIYVFLSQTWVKILCNWSLHQKACWYSMLKTLMARRPQKWLMPSVCTVKLILCKLVMFILSVFLYWGQKHYRQYILLSTLGQTCTHTGELGPQWHELGLCPKVVI